MRLGGLIISVLFLAVPAGAWPQESQTRSQVVQDNEGPRKANSGARASRKLPRRGVNKRQALGVEPRFVERLMRMPAPEREKFLQENPRFQRLPAAQRERIEQRLRRLSQMDSAQRDQVLERYRLFDQLPEDRQAEARTIYQKWRQLPLGRRRELLDEYDGLRDSAPEARRSRLSSKEFSSAYSDEEQRILRDLSGLLPERAVPE